MPKFEFESDFEWDLHYTSFIERLCPYLQIVFGASSLDLRDMSSDFEDGVRSIKISSKSNFINNEYGSFLIEDTELADTDYILDNRGIEVNINKGFLFAIVNKNKKLLNFGLYNGG